MRVALVTSEVTFVPDNYAAVIEGLSGHATVAGLIIISNRTWSLLFQALSMILTFSAPRLGASLLYNWIFTRTGIRRKGFGKNKKFVYIVKNINSEYTKSILQKEKIDLILNARAQSVFKKETLNVTPMGIYNIHHGILPYQRGEFCDFWAHYDQVGAGFSIHKLTPKMDDGDIIIACKVNSTLSNYIEHLLVSAHHERRVCVEFLDQLEKERSITPIRHLRTYVTQSRKNPKIKDFYAVQGRGVRI